MSKYFTDNGFISDDGNKLLKPFYDGLIRVLSSPQVQSMSFNELEMLKGNLAKLTGCLTSELILAKIHRESK
jgi:hypothetical protein